MADRISSVRSGDRDDETNDSEHDPDHHTRCHAGERGADRCRPPEPSREHGQRTDPEPGAVQKCNHPWIEEARTLATITLLGIGLAILLSASRPLKLWKVVLAVVMAASYGLIMAFEWTRDFFKLDLFTTDGWVIVAAAVGVAGVAIYNIPRIVPGLARS